MEAPNVSGPAVGRDSPAEHPAAPRQGLSAAEACARAARGEVNRTPHADWAEYRDIVVRNVFTLFNALIGPAAVALFFFGAYQDAWSVSAMGVINSALGLAQEIRAKRHLDKLALLVATRARVIRDGTVDLLPAGDVVRGDHILLTAGDPVVADGPLLEARFLEVDESLLTGESDPVPRKTGDRVLSGSFAVAGEGVYRADQVGSAALANQTAILARQYRHLASPLQLVINWLIRVLTAAAVALCILYVVLYFHRSFAARDLVAMIAATVTSMVPQGLVLMTTLALSLGAVRLSRRGAVVQRLPAVESMAAVNVLCMDKTGTLTTSRLRLDHICVLDDGINEEAVRARLRRFVWGSLDAQSKSILALRTALGPAGEEIELVDQLPFKSQNRYSAVRVRCGGGEHVLVLGGYEALRLHLETTTGEGCENVWKELLPSGLRLLLFAEARGADLAGLAPFNGSLPNARLAALALVALSDELRPEAGAVLEELARQGIGFKIISGDNPETVRVTVGHLPLGLAHAVVITGEQLAAATELTRIVAEESIFGRVTPQQKIDIVSALQQQGRHVAMIGDGINDILAIKRADLGIAMGEGSAATKTVAGLVLENNNFQLLPAALEEGRTILRNLRRAAKLFLLKNVYAFFLIVFAMGVFGLEFPFLPRQVTLLNALTIGIPALIITVGRDRFAVPNRPGFLREVGIFVLSSGLLIGVAGLVVMLIAARTDPADVRLHRTLLLSTLILLGLGSLLRVVTHGETQVLTRDRLLRLLALAALPVYLATMYVPVLARFFELTPLTVTQWAVVLAVAGPAFLLCKIIDWLGWA
ncbi:hypothetical protein AYO44_09935 [Planctomycetaceae bacterium SCGC AG-212-F19]|nr:hypothetical protein AYO44_09935 [Planctomycetaceae bacterium SCGC AG-212-F19]